MAATPTMNSPCLDEPVSTLVGVLSTVSSPFAVDIAGALVVADGATVG